MLRAIAWASGGAALGAISGAGMVLVGALGTPDQPPRLLRLTYPRGIVSSARFAPHRETIIYSAAWQGRNYETFETRIGSRESRPLGISNGRVVSVSQTGEVALIVGPQLFFSTQGTLVHAPLTSVIAPRARLDSVREADWIAGESELAVVRRVGVLDVLEFPIGRKVHEAPSMRALRVSPDGNRVAAFEGADETGEHVSLVVVDRSGKRTVLSSSWRVAQGLAWSPRANEVWFSATEGVLAPAVQAVTLAGKVRPLFHAPMLLRLQDVSPEGRVLVTMIDSRFSLSCLAPDASSERDLSWLDGSWAPSISGDGKFVLFSEGRAGGSTLGMTFLRATDLANLVCEIRAALGEDASNPRFIRTAHRFGYAFRTAGNTKLHGDPEPPPNAGGCRLLWRGQRMTLGDGRHVVGRDPNADIYLDSTSVSRRHASIRIADGQAMLEDLGSKNGTFVGKRRIDSITVLADGDRIHIGSIELIFRIVQGAGSTRTSADEA